MDDLIDFGSPSPASSFLNQKSFNHIPLASDFQLPCSSLTNRQSLSFVEDCGRESLGILPNFDCSTTDVISKCLLDDFNNSELHHDVSSSILPVEEENLLKPLPIFKLSGSPTSSTSVLFNSNSLNDPSKIFSVGSSGSSTNLDLLNKSFSNTNSFVTGFKLRTNTSDFNKARLFDSLELNGDSSFPNCSNDNSDDNGKFNDSVFIEAKYLASKIADGSILEEDANNLDETPQPDLVELDESKLEEPICDTETIFKTVDKFLPPTTIANLSNISRVSQGSDTNSKAMSVSEVNHTTASQSSKITSQETRDIIQNLSERLNNTRRSDKDKSKAQSILNNLAVLLCDKSNSSLEDSGHSSSTDEQQHQEKVSKKSTRSLSEVTPSTITTTKRRLSQSLLAPCDKKLKIPTTTNIPTNSGSHSVVSVNSSNDSSSSRVSFLSKLKPHKVEGKSIGRGPLKAVIPIGDMAKHLSLPSTPKRLEVPLQSKRTSTPLKEPKLRPIAQSTPTHRRLSKDVSISPLAGPSVQGGQSVNKTRIGLSRSSSVTTPLKPKPAPVVRRNSVSELKKPTVKALDAIKTPRRNSTGKQSGLMSVLGKVRQNLNDSIKKTIAENGECSILRNGFGFNEKRK